MPVLALFLPLARLLRLAFTRAVASAAWIFQRRDRTLTTLVAALALAVWWQHREAAQWAAKSRQTEAAWQAERRSAQAAKTLAENRYRSQARDADLAHAKALADGHAALAAYVRTHRMRANPQANPASPAQNRDPALPAIASAQAIVASLTDLQTCDADYAYARAAHEWAKGLGAQG